MKKFFLTISSVVLLSIGAHAQLFKASDVAKIADYVVDELQLTGQTAESVKSIYADYGEQMRTVAESMQGLGAKQNQIQNLTKEMDAQAKSAIPSSKSADYDIVANHYRKRGIGSSALNNSQAMSSNTQAIQTDMGEAKELSETLKNELKSQLGVNDTQADQLVKITFEHNLQKKVINQTLKSDALARATKMKELNESTNTKVKNILNDQQYKKFLMILIKNQ